MVTRILDRIELDHGWITSATTEFHADRDLIARSCRPTEDDIRWWSQGRDMYAGADTARDSTACMDLLIWYPRHSTFSTSLGELRSCPLDAGDFRGELCITRT